MDETDFFESPEEIRRIVAPNRTSSFGFPDALVQGAGPRETRHSSLMEVLLSTRREIEFIEAIPNVDGSQVRTKHRIRIAGRTTPSDGVSDSEIIRPAVNGSGDEGYASYCFAVGLPGDRYDIRLTQCGDCAIAPSTIFDFKTLLALTLLCAISARLFGDWTRCDYPLRFRSSSVRRAFVG